MALLDSIKTYKKMLIEIDEPITDKVIAVQEDAESRYLDVQLFKNGVPFDLTGAKVRIYMDKPDGTKIMNDGEIKDPTSGRCQFKLTTQALAACGNLRTQIKGFSETEEQILSTQIFDIKVTESLLTNETIESTNEYGSLVILFQDIYEALQVMTAIKNNFGEPGETAGTVPATTFWQMLEAVYNVNTDALKNASVSEVLKRIGESTDESTEPTLFGKIAGIQIIKSVQRGIITKIPDTGIEGKTYEIQINSVDPNKCFVILNSGMLSVSSSMGGDSLILKDLSANILKVTVFTTNTGGSASFCWQVIECF